MGLVSSRIASNINCHGLRFAVEEEIRRFVRRGLGQEAAISAGLLAVSAVLKQARG